jgi:hypothetical protein
VRQLTGLLKKLRHNPVLDQPEDDAVFNPVFVTAD